MKCRSRHGRAMCTNQVYRGRVNFPLERRKEILDISNKYSIPIIENESYADFRIDGPDLPPAMMAIDENESVMYISAFTKLLGCGLRLGFGVFPDSAKESMQKVSLGHSPSHLASMAVYEYLKNHKDSYVQGVSQSLGAMRDSMLRALGEFSLHLVPGQSLMGEC